MSLGCNKRKSLRTIKTSGNLMSQSSQMFRCRRRNTLCSKPICSISQVSSFPFRYLHLSFIPRQASIKLETEQDLKGVIKNPRPYYQRVKGPLSAQIEDSDSAAASSRPVTPAPSGEHAETQKEGEQPTQAIAPPQSPEKGDAENVESKSDQPSTKVPIADDVKGEDSE